MGRRGRRRARESPGGGEAVATSDYADAEGNLLTLRDSLSDGTLRQIGQLDAKPAVSAEDVWQRRVELLFERLAVRWEIAGLPLTKQKELLGRFRMADGETQRWVRQTIDDHLRRHQPELVE